MIKHAVVDQVREFYWCGFDRETGPRCNEIAYKQDVLSKDKKRPFRASLLWLVEAEAITLAQADRLDDIYDHRHDLTHELGKYIIDVAAIEILRDITRFWKQIEIDIGAFEEHWRDCGRRRNAGYPDDPSDVHRRVRSGVTGRARRPAPRAGPRDGGSGHDHGGYRCADFVDRSTGSDLERQVRKQAGRPPGDPPGDPPVVLPVARLERTVLTEHHDGARLGALRGAEVEVLGAVRRMSPVTSTSPSKKPATRPPLP